ncbi:CGNR zinc finger domain-containing protein [Paracidobacterium acidisoli]|uniref:Zinc finger CGNR domain-containing protein n=1 Tax=Paracidobacterium acidisoli TaxID=2303751 RepID=A0A372ITK6_9BACT|nr:CGNR zinc finger domain-containing protein [Paracidobacterium acidisoli]MBT9329670.1 CGNR zinc finger domain-containing protein [Paracidobacterium acidisoli]
MGTASQEAGEWIDGFLFVANRPILDFLNTKPVLADGLTELLTDSHALERWLIASGTVSTARMKALLRSWRHSAEAEAFLKDLLIFRERLREAVLRMESGAAPAEEFLKDVNAHLARYPLHIALHRREGKVVREMWFEPRQPADFWAPIMDATADLLAETDMSRLRKCESCVVHFFDTSKKGSRRWCSMNICGNRLKVAAYQRRKRDRDLPGT